MTLSRKHEFSDDIRKQPFFCPVCKEPLTVKAGKIRIPHFSHKKDSNCLSASSERESIQHLNGKLQLLEFFQKHHVPVKLEYYLPKIQQRPDLLIKYNNRLFAIEYQCSSIPKSILHARTKGYIQEGIAPIWIVGGLPYRKKRHYFYYLSDMHWSVAQFKGQSGLSLISYCSSRKKFYSLTNIIPFSKNKIIGALHDTTLMNAKMPLSFTNKRQPTLDGWEKEKQNYLHQLVYYNQNLHHRFLAMIYHAGMNPYLLPSIVGIPVKGMEVFANHPIEWQFYLYLDSLKQLNKGEKISIKYLTQKIRHRIKYHFIRRRGYLFQNPADDRLPIEHYLKLLTALGYLTKLNDDLYQMKQSIMIPNTYEEALSREKQIMNNIMKQKNYNKKDQVVHYIS